MEEEKKLSEYEIPIESWESLQNRLEKAKQQLGEKWILHPKYSPKKGKDESKNR